jgi:transcriptional regulator with XRE-family HTH domain
MVGRGSGRNRSSIGERVRARRRELGLSQRDVSEAGLTYAYVSRIEAGQRTPSVKALRKLAPKLKTTVAWLETGQEDPAYQLARLVLEHRGQPLPPAALRIARQVLGRAGAEPN